MNLETWIVSILLALIHKFNTTLPQQLSHYCFVRAHLFRVEGALNSLPRCTKVQKAVECAHFLTMLGVSVPSLARAPVNTSFEKRYTDCAWSPATVKLLEKESVK